MLCKNKDQGRRSLDPEGIMAGHIIIFGMGYTGTRLGQYLRTLGWRVTGVRRASDPSGILAFDDQGAIQAELSTASHILSSVPPDQAGKDPVLVQYGRQLASAPARWCGYISSTGVYGNTRGAWVDEASPIGKGRRQDRAMADRAWQSLRPDITLFRLPGIYGPGRNPLLRILEGKAHRIDAPDQIFSRIHVDDIVSGICRSFTGPAGLYNLADDHPCSQNEVVVHGCTLLGITPPPLIPLDSPSLGKAARQFYTESRRVSNNKARRLLQWRPAYPDYRAGLDACLQEDKLTR